MAASELEGNAREFLGERKGNMLEGLSPHQLADPEPERVGMGLAIIKSGLRADDKQFKQVAIAYLRHPSQPFLSSQGVLARRQAEPGRELARTPEAGNAATLAAMARALTALVRGMLSKLLGLVCSSIG